MSIKIRRQNIDLEYIDLEYKGWENVCKNKTLYNKVTLLGEYKGEEIIGKNRVTSGDEQGKRKTEKKKNGKRKTEMLRKKTNDLAVRDNFWTHF